MPLLVGAAREDAASSLQLVLGVPRIAAIAEGDTLLDIAHRDRLGFEQVVRFNPGVDVWVPPAAA